MDIPEGYGNRKTWCPFGTIAHPDSGVAAAFRLYEDTNSAYCFACSRAWTPVALMAEVWDCARAEAAEKMCRAAGITLPTWQDKWAMLHEPAPANTAALAEALKQWCRRVRGPRWETDQFEERFSDPLAACFRLLPLVTGAEEATAWLEGSKQIMESRLRGEEGDG